MESSGNYSHLTDTQLQEFYEEAEASQAIAQETILSIQDERCRRWWGRLLTTSLDCNSDNEA